MFGEDGPDAVEIDKRTDCASAESLPGCVSE